MANLFDKFMQSFLQFWSARDARERVILSLGAGVVVFTLIYLSFIDPALTGREQLRKSLPVLRQQVAQLQALSKEAAALSANPAVVVAVVSKELIEGAMARKGIKSQNVVLSGDQVKVQLEAVSFANTLDWLEEMQTTARLIVVDANIVALAQPDMVNITLMLRQQRHE